jgi:RNA-directed DNA polymerase
LSEHVGKLTRAVLRGESRSNAAPLPDNIRHYPAPQTARSGWKLLIKPSKKSIQELRKKLKQQWEEVKGNPIQVVLNKLNPIIRGWANYYRTVVASEIFQSLDNWMFQREDHYAKQMHPNKSQEWRHQKYWGRLNLERLDNWTFGDKQTGRYLLKFGWFPIERHALVSGTASPDDPNLKEYWMKRQRDSARDLTNSRQKLAKRQKGRCLECGESLFNDEEVQIHHRWARSQGGNDTYSNLVLVHLFCHQHIHAKTERAISDCQPYNDREVLTKESKTTQRSMQNEKKEQCCQ